MWIDWLQFVFASLLIIIAGAKITFLADEISDRTGIGKAFIGVLLLGMATSLPEVITSLSSVILYNASEMAVGNLLGSCTFNLLIIAIIDFIFKLENADRRDLSAGPFSLIMLLLFVAGFVTKTWPSFYLHPLSFIILLAYILSLWRIYKIEQQAVSGQQVVQATNGQQATGEQESDLSPDEDSPFSILLFRTLVAATTLVLASIWLSGTCDRIGEQTGLGGTIMGAFFMAVATSLPELVVSISAMRIGQLGMSLGNIFGSNIFNMGILALVDISDGVGGIFASVTVTHLILAIVAILMTIVLLIGFVYGSSSMRFLRLRPSSWFALIIYIAGSAFLFYNVLV